jgi:ubiquinone/menaquinone biosynthesis C-methylase UbiE
MHFLGIFQHLLSTNARWMSDYRTKTLIPTSGKVIIGTLLILVIGIAFVATQPDLYAIGLTLIILASLHLAVIVVAGVGMSLSIRKLRNKVRGTVLRSIPWRGTENVLDVACGTGMLVNGCARQLTTGKAIGIDLWEESVAGTREILLANAQAEGVASKVEIKSMDARHLAFEDARFDVVVSSLALHHIGSQPADREQAVSEMIRVLAPGGYLSLVDVGAMIDIAESVITKAGLQIIRREPTRFVRFITARKA